MTSSANLTVPSLFDFRDHVVLVTGGATGLGEMAAQAFVQNGARVFIASRKESELKKARHHRPGREGRMADCGADLI
jgi:short-subunit dehydrogenase involved in D-alanine esterification of teichoic acids